LNPVPVPDRGEEFMIDGIGGAFLFTNDAKRLAGWYRDCLGMVPSGEDSECSSIFKSFDYRDFENPEIKKNITWAIIPTKDDIKDKPRTGQINYTVKNMAEILEHLKSKGVPIEKTAEYEYGKFAWLKDPDGNKVELWEPAKEH
jgi:predicted enzyme related to lactoylglutathione lyase